MSEKSRISRPATIFVFIIIASVFSALAGTINKYLFIYVESYILIFTMSAILEAIAGYAVPIIIESGKFTPTRQGTRYIVYLAIITFWIIFSFALPLMSNESSVYIAYILLYSPRIAYVIAMFISARVMFNKNWKKEKERMSSEQANNIQETTEQQQTIEKQGTE